MTLASDPTRWAESVAQYMLDTNVCPVCTSASLVNGCCSHCGADLRGPHGAKVWEASVSAADAIRGRNQLIARIPRIDLSHTSPVATDPNPLAPTAIPASASTVAPASAHTQQPALAAPPLAASAPRASVTIQSVLAIAGAALFAIAALIFTFLNPDLSDRVMRSAVVGFVTLIFLGGAGLLARRGLQFSAEAVGALGLVFVALDVYSFAQLGETSASTFLIAAAATAGASAVMFAAGALSKVRVWQWSALIGTAAVPALLGYAAESEFAAALGHLGSAFLACALTEIWPRIARRSLTAVQVIAVVSALPLALVGTLAFGSAAWALLAISLVFALISVHALFASRHLLRPWWSFLTGSAATMAMVLVVLSPLTETPGDWMLAAVPTTAAFTLALIAVCPLPRTVSRFALSLGSLLVVSAVALVPLGHAASTALDALSDVVRGVPAQVVSNVWGWAALIGMVGIAAGLALFGGLIRDRPHSQERESALRKSAAFTDVLSIVSAALAVLTLACSNLLPLPARVAIVLGAAAIASVAVAWRTIRVPANHISLIVAIHTAVATGMLISWLDPSSAAISGLGILAVLALASLTLPASIRFLHVGVGFAYALICLGQALSLTSLGNIAVLCLVASAALVSAIIVTFERRIVSRNWYAILVVTVVPFAAGIVQVIFERSGWTALSTALMFALALALLVTRRPGLGIALRTAAAAMLVPTIAVVIVCLGAQILSISASPVTLPVIAAIVALSLTSTTLIRDALRKNALPADAAAAVRIAIEASALLTGAIATALALARDAAGLGTTFLVLVILGVGSAASAAFVGRRYGWWVSGVAFTGALWCVWSLNGVVLLEAYLLPPALAAAGVATILTARGVEVRALFAAGLGVAVIPSLALVAFVEPEARTASGIPWRALALLAAGIVLIGVAALFSRLGRRLRIARVRMLVPPTLVAAGIAAIAGPVQGVHMPSATSLHGVVLFLACLAVSAVAAIILACVARGIRRSSRATSQLRRTRWLSAPAMLALAAGTWSAIERDWGSIWLMWTLMIGLLVVMLVSAVRSKRTTLPPVWLLFALSFVTAIVAWSPRDLRVEWFSLPLGAFLLLAGIHGLRAARSSESGGGMNAWPQGYRSSWALLAPGIVTMMSASIVATFTDPLTWRAILVMVLALAAIMAGAGKRLAAPFILGMLVLPIENVFVFSVQIGRGIESMPWWITLAVIGAVLLIIAVTYERRTGDSDTVVARMRDLR